MDPIGWIFSDVGVQTLTEWVFYFQVIFTLTISGLVFLLIRKFSGIALSEIRNEVGAVFAILAAYLVWTQFFASLVLTGATILVFYLFGGVLMSFAAFLAVMLK